MFKFRTSAAVIFDTSRQYKFDISVLNDRCIMMLVGEKMNIVMGDLRQIHNLKIECR